MSQQSESADSESRPFARASTTLGAVALVRLFLLMVFPWAFAVLWVFLSFRDEPRFLIGLPFLLAGFALAVHGWTGARRANRAARLVDDYQGREGLGAMFLAWLLTLTGALLPLYLL